MTDRKPLSKRTRFEVFKRDEFACQYCGAHPPEVLLEVDHITPVAEGGENDFDNLLTACFKCNRGKGAVSLTVVPKSLQERGSEIQEMEDQVAGYREIVEARRSRIEECQWEIAEILFPGSSEKGLRRDWLLSIKRFIERLPIDEIMEAAEVAYNRFAYSNNNRFKYFCGICWRKIKEASPE